MKIIKTKNYSELSIKTAEIVIGQIHSNPNSTLVLPTGNTPLGMFSQLSIAFKKNIVSFNNCFLIELDDYWQIPMNDNRNLYNWLDKSFIQNVNFKLENITRFNTSAINSDNECHRVEKNIKKMGGIDLVVFGVGPNGHLGFNEPGSKLNSKTRIIDLSPESITSSANYWGSEENVPQQGITLGLSSLLAAKKIILLVNGKHKAQIYKQAIHGPITPLIPASYLQQHKHLTVIVDQDAYGE